MQAFVSALRSLFGGNSNDEKQRKKEEAARLLKLGGMVGYEYVVDPDGKTRLHKSRAAFPELYAQLDQLAQQKQQESGTKEDDKSKEEGKEEAKEAKDGSATAPTEAGKDEKKKDELSVGFEFTTQEHYVALGNAVANEIYRRMTEMYGLERVEMHGDGGVDGVPIFMSPGLIDSDKPLVVMCCGSGQVTAGMWARSICINKSLEEGSALPDIAEAQKNGYNVLLLNPNVKPPAMTENKKKKASGSETWSPEKHVITAWRQYVEPSHASKIALFVHSYGGVCALELLKQVEKKPEVFSRLCAMVMTDAVHYQRMGKWRHVKAFIQDRTRVINWVRSELALDVDIGVGASGIYCKSSGHNVHEWTTYSARSSLWPFLVHNISRDLPVYVIPEHVEGEEEDDEDLEVERLIKLGGLCGYEYVKEDDGKTRLHKTRAAFPRLYRKLDEMEKDESKKEEIGTMVAFKQMNQQHFLAVVEGARVEICKRLTEGLGLERVYLHGDPKEENVPVFMTPGLVESEKPLVVIICGSGAVSPGMWSRHVTVEASLEEGSAIPDVEEAQKHGYNVLLMNPNCRTLMGDSAIASPEEHALYVWKHFVEPCHAKQIALFVHSYGGVLALELLQHAEETPELLSRIKTIVMTDSVHRQNMDKFPLAKALIQDKTKVINWVASDKQNPLDAPIGEGASGIFTRSSGHIQHEWTTCSARSALWPFLVSNIENKSVNKETPPEKPAESTEQPTAKDE